MGRLILIPFVVHPSVPQIPNVVVPIGPIYPRPADCVTARQDVIDWYRLYLGRDPEDEGAIAGRIGRPCLDVELEIATSQEAVQRLTAGSGGGLPPGVGVTLHGLTEWDKRAGLLLADRMAQELGIAAAPSGAWIVLAVQAHIEDAGGTSYGARTNNPLNLRPRGGAPWPGQIGISPGNFSEFDSLENGALACAMNYTSADSGGYYSRVAAAFRAGDLAQLAAAIDESPWNAGGYGGRIARGFLDAIGETA